MITFLLIEKGKITMLFNNKELQSNFDIGKDLPDEQANINCLAEEIIRITEKIYNIEGKNLENAGLLRPKEAAAFDAEKCQLDRRKRELEE